MNEYIVSFSLKEAPYRADIPVQADDKSEAEREARNKLDRDVTVVKVIKIEEK